MILVTISLTFFITIITVHFFLKIKNQHKVAGIRKKGVNGEITAKKWLSKHGFHNIKSQKSYNFSYTINNKKKTFSIRPDFIATKKNELWVIEVKTGKSASISDRSTRRQIREYATLLPCDKYALFDATNRKLSEISFDLSKRKNIIKKKSYASLAITLLIGAIIGSIITLLVI
jgi:Holliday junction resolvase